MVSFGTSGSGVGFSTWPTCVATVTTVWVMVPLRNQGAGSTKLPLTSSST